MARWAFCWMLVIALATIGLYNAANSLGASSQSEGASYAMLPLGELGSPTCTRAGRALVAAADGTDANASAERRKAYERAAATVLAACGAG